MWHGGVRGEFNDPNTVQEKSSFFVTKGNIKVV